MTTTLSDDDKATLVNQVIDDYFERALSAAKEVDKSYAQLWQTLHKLMRSGGKRLRSQMVLLAYEAFSGEDVEKLIPVAAAQELLHFCLLIHDDVIDRDYIRYGTHNVAGWYKIAYSKYVKTAEDQTHYAHSAAILGGDLMLAGAHQLIATSLLSESETLVAESYLARSVFEVAAGELLDTELSFMPYTEGDALKVARYKTASYSFISPLLTGATLASASQQQLDALTSYAEALGTAYQLVDDILGAFGTTEQTGKSAASDILEGKRTYMVEWALRFMSPVDKHGFEKAFGNPKAGKADIEKVKKLFETTGARQATMDMAGDYAAQARAAIPDLGLDKDMEQKFDRLITTVTKRSH